MIEIWFSTLAKRVIRHGDFPSRQDLADKIEAFTILYNQTAKPYRWTYGGTPSKRPEPQRNNAAPHESSAQGKQMRRPTCWAAHLRAHSFLATSGPVIRCSSGRVEAMIPSDATRPARTMR